jgi:Metal-dependent hydrolases of the beta-lactamase superfamily I
MSLFIASLNSGSNGNCYYISNDDEAVLIDAGISCKETEKRLKRLGLSIRKVKAIFISHEHGDHIHGVGVLSRKHKLPVYITPRTRQLSNIELKEEYTHSFVAYQPVTIGALTITAFPKFHDASDPHSFIIQNRDVTVGVFTDIGTPCEHLIQHFKKCHAAFLESNYDEVMLNNGSYPYPLKERIRGTHGHLSNAQALQLFLEHRPPFMSHLLLSHLSRDNNAPKLVKALFEQHAEGTEIIIASRQKESKLYHIRNQPKINSVKLYSTKEELQLSLF